MNCTTEQNFLLRVEGLITEFAGCHSADLDLLRRRDYVLTEGYGRALALEGQRRRLHERQLELANLHELGADALRELSALARREAGLIREEQQLRVLLAPLRKHPREAPLGKCSGDDPPPQRLD